MSPSGIGDTAANVSIPVYYRDAIYHRRVRRRQQSDPAAFTRNAILLQTAVSCRCQGSGAKCLTVWKMVEIKIDWCRRVLHLNERQLVDVPCQRPARSLLLVSTSIDTPSWSLTQFNNIKTENEKRFVRQPDKLLHKTLGPREYSSPPYNTPMTLLGVTCRSG